MQDPRWELSQADTTAERLAEIAQQHPELASEIDAHPNAYPELRQWIREQQAANQPQLADSQAPQAQQFTGSTVPIGQQEATPFPTTPFDANAANTGFGGGPGGYDPSTLGAPAPRSRGRSILWISLASALVLLLAIGGGVWWFIGSKLGGSASPEAAAEKLVKGFTTLDPLTLYGSFAPSEFAAFEESARRLTSIKPTEESTYDLDEASKKLAEAIDVQTTREIVVEADELAEEVQRVTYVDGAIKINGDKDEIVDLYLDVVRENAKTLSDEFEPDYDALEEGLRESLDLPYTIDFKDIAQDMEGSPFDGVTLVTVKEGGSWYVSPMMTVADYAYLDAEASGNAGKLGDAVVAGKPSETAVEAADALGNAVVEFAEGSGELEEIAERLPLAERRIVSIYGPALIPEDASWSNEIDLEQSYQADKEDSSRVEIESLTGGNSYTDLDSGLKLENWWSLERSGNDYCVTTHGEWAYNANDSSGTYDQGDLFDLYYEDYYFDYDTFDDFLENFGLEPDWQVKSSENSGCLSDVPLSDELGLNEIDIIGVEEGGGWFISPIATVADATAIVSERLAKLAEEGKLDDTIRDEIQAVSY